MAYVGWPNMAKAAGSVPEGKELGRSHHGARAIRILANGPNLLQMGK
jgi:hypothetical protein